MKYVTTIDNKEYIVDVIDERHVSINGSMIEIDFHEVSGQGVYSLLIGGKSYEAYVYPGDENWQVLLRGRLYDAIVEDEREKRLRSTAGGGVAEGGEYIMKAPMPGLVVAVQVKDGDVVKKGQTLIILESMKMQNELKSPKDGTISRIRVKQGDSIEIKAPMLSVV
jgi:acetyl/propionyl-CoA carboxylase alpha subunit